MKSNIITVLCALFAITLLCTGCGKEKECDLEIIFRQEGYIGEYVYSLDITEYNDTGDEFFGFSINSTEYLLGILNNNFSLNVSQASKDSDTMTVEMEMNEARIEILDRINNANLDDPPLVMDVLTFDNVKYYLVDYTVDDSEYTPNIDRKCYLFKSTEDEIIYTDFTVTYSSLHEEGVVRLARYEDNICVVGSLWFDCDDLKAIDAPARLKKALTKDELSKYLCNDSSLVTVGENIFRVDYSDVVGDTYYVVFNCYFDDNSTRYYAAEIDLKGTVKMLTCFNGIRHLDNPRLREEHDGKFYDIIRTL